MPRLRHMQPTLVPLLSLRRWLEGLAIKEEPEVVQVGMHLLPHAYVLPCLRLAKSCCHARWTEPAKSVLHMAPVTPTDDERGDLLLALEDAIKAT